MTMWTSRASIASLVDSQRLEDMVIPVETPIVMAKVRDCHVFVVKVLVFQEWHAICNRTISFGRFFVLDLICKVVLKTIASFLTDIDKARREIGRIDSFAVKDEWLVSEKPH